MSVDGPAHLHEAAGPEELDRVRHDRVGPAALLRALLQSRRELLPQPTHDSSCPLVQGRRPGARGLIGRSTCRPRPVRGSLRNLTRTSYAEPPGGLVELPK